MTGYGDVSNMEPTPIPDLSHLRARIDQLDAALVAIVSERLAVCREVAEVKQRVDAPVIQPARVRDVVTSRRQLAIEAGVDPDFAEQLFRVLLTETHRIEVAGHRPDPAPEKAAEGNGSPGLDTVVSRVDHEVPLAEPHAGMAGVAAGGVTFVLVAPEASQAVARYVAERGGGVQHVALEVLNAGYARACLADSGAPLLTEVVVDADGHEQFFAATDEATGVQLGFISRTGHRVGVSAANVLALFDAIDPAR